jgi:large repetitive protein
VRRRLATLVAVGALLGGMLSVAGVALAANQAANLDQCANDPATAPLALQPPTNGCSGAAGETSWVNGNLGASKSIYREGDSIAYRMRFSNLAGGTGFVHSVIVEYDTTKAGKHAIDYLTTWNRTVGNANPCLGVAGCTLASPTSTRAIPVDNQVKNGPNGALGGGDDINPGPDGTTGTADDAVNCTTPNVPCTGVFTMWGGTITNVAPVTYPDGAGFAGDKTARFIISFQTVGTITNPVLAWGGHIATRQNWPGASAINISGSPYHMRLIDLDGSGGNQDRSLSADAVIFPGSITIIKDTVPNNAQNFGFTTTGGLSPSTFTLDDDGDPTLSNTQNFPGIITFTTYTVSETATTGWDLTNRVCVISNPNGGSAAPSGATSVSINLKEGESVTCTFTNTPTPAPALGIDKVVDAITNPDDTDGGDTVDEAGDVIDYTITATNNGNVTLTGVTVSDPLLGTLVCTIDDVAATSPFTLTAGQSVVCTGSYTVSQDDIDNNGGDGTDDGDGDIDNTATADSNETGPASDSEAVPLDGTPTASIDKVVTSITNPDDTDGGSTADQAGDVIAYTITYSNDGNQTLTGVTVSDPLLGTLACTIDDVAATSPFTLAPGESVVCTGSYTVTQDDIDAGGNFDISDPLDGQNDVIRNTATGDSDQTDPTDDSEDVPVDQDPAFTIDKTVTGVSNPDESDDADGIVDQVGDVIHYQVVVENTGNQTLTGVSAIDSITTLDCTWPGATGTLAPGESVTCTGSYTVTQADIDAGGNYDTDEPEDGLNDVIRNVATGDSDQTDPQDDDTETPVLVDGAIDTDHYFIPQDEITLSGLTSDAAGDLYVALRIDGTECNSAVAPAWDYTWVGVGNDTYKTADVTGIDANDVIVSDDATVRWCTSYSGDEHNAAIALHDRGEVAVIDFDPLLAAGLGASVPMLAWFLWSQRKRREDQAA